MYLLTRRALVEDCECCDGEGRIKYTEEQLAAIKEKNKDLPCLSGCVTNADSYECPNCKGEGFIVLEKLKTKKQYFDNDDY